MDAKNLVVAYPNPKVVKVDTLTTRSSGGCSMCNPSLTYLFGVKIVRVATILTVCPSPTMSILATQRLSILNRPFVIYPSDSIIWSASKPNKRRIWNSQTKSYSSSTNSPNVQIVEVGPRDGLQNIKTSVPTSTKIELIRRLADTGLVNIEATSFVSPKWVPQLADGVKVTQEIFESPGHVYQGRQMNYPVLAPNSKGLENASRAGAKEIVVFASVTEAFSKANQNCTVEEALQEAQVVTAKALKLGIKVRG